VNIVVYRSEHCGLPSVAILEAKGQVLDRCLEHSFHQARSDRTKASKYLQGRPRTVGRIREVKSVDSVIVKHQGRDVRSQEGCALHCMSVHSNIRE
jgi:hypothetical protein